jgi:K+-transporting ATPase ATPase C chain
MNNIGSQLRLLVFTIVTCGVLYQVVLTFVGQFAITYQASGSLLQNGEGEVVGSQVIGQLFANANYFHSRRSLIDYNPHEVKISTEAGDFSASGLDPHITVQKAIAQLKRVSSTRHIDIQRLKNLVLSKAITNFEGSDIVNVLELNLALDKKFGKPFKSEERKQ